jgi:hypothetical protein
MRGGSLLMVVLLASCGGGDSSRAAKTAEANRAVQQKRDAWDQQQVQQDCVPQPYDEQAIQVVRGAHQGNTKLAYDPPDCTYQKGRSYCSR